MRRVVEKRSSQDGEETTMDKCLKMTKRMKKLKLLIWPTFKFGGGGCGDAYQNSSSNKKTNGIEIGGILCSVFVVDNNIAMIIGGGRGRKRT
ncbi:hypothetical protein TYRP_020655, partial [Tyrophagus putrescentiae]